MSKFIPRILSGIQPTGVPHIGNYFGAIRQWVMLQNRLKFNEETTVRANLPSQNQKSNLEFDKFLLGIVDQHSITLKTHPHGKELNHRIVETTACLIAAGIDPKRCIIFQQSKVPVHSQLFWILCCSTSLQSLQTLSQWREKSPSKKSVPLGLYLYPILQAADILAYRATHVPVGDDQTQHIHFARKLADKFNKRVGVEFFPKPQIMRMETELIGESEEVNVPLCNRVKNLKNPSVKMSKSDINEDSRIELLDSPETIRKKIRKCVTDSIAGITYNPVERPGLANLLEIHSFLLSLKKINEPSTTVNVEKESSYSKIIEKRGTNEDSVIMTPAALSVKYSHSNKLDYKMILADLMIDHLEPIRGMALELLESKKGRDNVWNHLHEGSEIANELSMRTYEDVCQLLGFRV